MAFRVFLALCIILVGVFPSYGDDPEEISRKSEELPILNGSAIRVLSKQTKLSISVDTLLSSEFSTPGDHVQAKILIPHEVTDRRYVALRGAVLRGHVTKVKRSRKSGRSGYLEIVYDELVLPSKSVIPIEATMRTESFRGKEALKTLAEDGKLLAKGAIWGTFTSLKISPVYALATDGLTLVAGAGIGITMGIAGSVRRYGEVKTSNQGDNHVLEFQNALNLSDFEITNSILAQKKLINPIVGFDMFIREAEITSSDVYEQILRVDVEVFNNTNTFVYGSDLMLVPLDGDDPIVPDIRLSQDSVLDRVPQGYKSRLVIYFPLGEKDYYLDDFKLVLRDPISKNYLAETYLLK